MKELIFLSQKMITVRLKNRILFVLTCFVTKTELFIHFTYLAKNLMIVWICCSYSMKTSHTMCILKISTGLYLIKQRIKTKSTFVGVVCSVLVVKMCLTEHKANCLVINGKQNVKLKKGLISFKNYSKQLPVLFKIYADFECILRPTS